MNEKKDVRRPRLSKAVLADAKPRPHRHGSAPPPRQWLVVVDRRTVISRCLGLWICAFEPEFHPVSTTSIEDAQLDDVVSRASAIIFCTGAAAPCEEMWLREQVAWARKNLPDVPRVLFAESPDVRLANATVRQLQLSGYIPTCSSLELAATALRLIIAGGRYVPQNYDESQMPAEPGPNAPRLPDAVASESRSRLTAREQSVLDLLEFGLPNKIIGYRLGMSQSTVKAHVHNIIAKLKVRNRTEAAVACFAAVIPQTSFASPVPAVSLNHKRPLDETA